MQYPVSYTCDDRGGRLRTITMGTGGSTSWNYSDSGWLTSKEDDACDGEPEGSGDRCPERAPEGRQSCQNAFFSRRTVKIHTAAAAEYFFYDGWSRAAWRAARPTGSAAPARRVAKPGGGGAINPTVIYGGPVSGTPTLSRACLWGLDVSGTFQGAGGVGGHLAVDFVGSGVYYPLADGNGNITEYLDTSGTVVAHYRYDPFGRTLYQTGTLVGNFEFRFSSKRIDPETGCYYYGYRYYNPYIGRWLNRDPIEELGGLNLYGFVVNDGVNTFDPVGLKEYDSVDDAIRACGEEAKLAAEKDAEERKKYNREFRENKRKGKKTTGLTMKKEEEYEMGGRVCYSKEKCKYYCTKMVVGQGYPAPGVEPRNTTPCNKGDEYAGFYHSHPGSARNENNILSTQDKNISDAGWYDKPDPGWPGKGGGEARDNLKKKPVGATTRVDGKLTTEIYPPPLTP